MRARVWWPPGVGGHWALGTAGGWVGGWGEGVCQAYVLQRREAARAGMRRRVLLMIGGSALWGHAARTRGGIAEDAPRAPRGAATYPPRTPRCLHAWSDAGS